MAQQSRSAHVAQDNLCDMPSANRSSPALLTASSPLSRLDAGSTTKEPTHDQADLTSAPTHARRHGAPQHVAEHQQAIAGRGRAPSGGIDSAKMSTALCASPRRHLVTWAWATLATGFRLRTRRFPAMIAASPVFQSFASAWATKMSSGTALCGRRNRLVETYMRTCIRL